jgi:hypothetical protein
MLATMILLAMLTLQAQAAGPDAELREATAKARAALLAENDEQVRATMATSAYHDMRNMIAATGQAYTPAMLKSAAMGLPDATQARTLVTQIKGDTALWIAQGDKDVVAVRLIRESGAWRFARINFFATLEKLDEATLLAALPPEFRATGEVPKVTPLLPEPQVLGQYSIQHSGLVGEVKFHEHVTLALKPIREGLPVGSSGVIVGGLKRGKNVITVSAIATAPGTPVKCDITIKTFEPGKMGEAKVVHQADVSAKLPGTVTIEFNIE